VAFAACLRPALRAAGADPAEVLRSESRWLLHVPARRVAARGGVHERQE